MANYYLAGPMSGYPQFNFPLFDRVSSGLRERGYDIVSPAELDDPKTRAVALESPDGDPKPYTEAMNTTWGDFLARDVKIVADQVDGVVCLPGWSVSRGANLEVIVALLCGKPVFAVDPATLVLTPLTRTGTLALLKQLKGEAA